MTLRALTSPDLDPTIIRLVGSKEIYLIGELKSLI